MQKNKIAVLISWPREIDIFSSLISCNQIDIILDDNNYSSPERKNNYTNLIKICRRKKIDYLPLSMVISREYYEILFSTGLSYKEKRSLKISIKYIYAHTIGSFLRFSKIYRIFVYFFHRTFTGGGKLASIFEPYQIERQIAKKVFRFPTGLDIATLGFPVTRWREAFDIHLCHGKIDKKLILQAFSDAECIKIGHPKYNNPIPIENAKEKIKLHFNIANDKPIILWIPTFIKLKTESLLNINSWLPHISLMTDKFNIIVRPHPKTIICNPDVISNLKSFGLFVDTALDTQLKNTYQAVDLVLADYGASVFSAIYMEKKILLLNLPKQSKFLEEVISAGKRLDLITRDSVNSLDCEDGMKLLEKINSLLLSSSNKTKHLKSQYFGSQNIVDIDHFVSKLINQHN